MTFPYLEQRDEDAVAAGTTGALPARMNAILDALRPQGVGHLDMPATAQAVWRALREAGS